ncbi:MAG: DUF4062 domain-containing protein [Rectinemataceae bacterium]
MDAARVARVFISSTFKDMHSERDYLVARVFPELRERCRALEVEVIDVDLRWGVTEEEAEGGMVLDICLEEIEKSRPFFVALLGERYGWVPLPSAIDDKEFKRILASLEIADRTFLEGCYAQPDPYGAWIRNPTMPASDERLAQLLENALHAPFAIPSNVPEDSTAPFKWLETARAGQSVTALEIRHGVLENPDMSERAFFFFRDPAFIAEVPEAKRGEATPEGPAAAVRQAALKNEITAAYSSNRDNLYSYSPSYAGLRIDMKTVAKGTEQSGAMDELLKVADDDGLVDPLEYATLSKEAQGILHEHSSISMKHESLEDFGIKIIDSLWQSIQAEFPAKVAPKSELEVEAATHARFRNEWSKGFLGREGALARIKAYMTGTEERSLIVIGEPGIGTSAFMARASRLVQEIDPGALVIESYARVTPCSQDLGELLARLTTELNQIAGHVPGKEQKGDDFAAIRTEFFSSIGRANSASKDRQVWLFIDAIDQMGTSNEPLNLNWLPFQLASALRIVVSANDSKARAAAERRELPYYLLEPLSSEEAAELVTYKLARFRKSLGFDTHRKASQLDLLLGKKGSRYPLYLTIASEELRIYPRFEELTGRIETMAEDVDGLVLEILERLERNFGRNLVSRAFSILHLSVGGLAESELLDLLAPEEEGRLAPHYWAAIRRSISGYLYQRGEGSELIDIVPGPFAGAIRKRYLDEQSKALRLAELAKYGFRQLRLAWNREGYIPRGTKEDCATYAYRSKDEGLFTTIWSEILALRKERATTNLDPCLYLSITLEGDRDSPDRICSLLEPFTKGPFAKQLYDIAEVPSWHFGDKGNRIWETAVDSLMLACARTFEAGANYCEKTSSKLNDIGNTELMKGNYDTARTHFHESFMIIEKAVTELQSGTDTGTSGLYEAKIKLRACIENLAMVANLRGDYAEAKKQYELSLLIAEELHNADPSNSEYVQQLAESIISLAGVGDIIPFPASRLRAYAKAFALLEATDSEKSNVFTSLYMSASCRNDFATGQYYLEKSSSEYDYYSDQKSITATIAYAATLAGFADSAYELGNNDVALDYAQKAGMLLENCLNIDPEFEILEMSIGLYCLIAAKVASRHERTIMLQRSSFILKKYGKKRVAFVANFFAKWLKYENSPLGMIRYEFRRARFARNKKLGISNTRQRKLVIGAAVPFTGEKTWMGGWMKNGYTIALKQANKNRIHGDKPIRLACFNSEDNADGASRACAELIQMSRSITVLAFDSNAESASIAQCSRVPMLGLFDFEKPVTKVGDFFAAWHQGFIRQKLLPPLPLIT